MPSKNEDIQMRDGDIYSWSWTEDYEKELRDRCPSTVYWCKSRIARCIGDQVVDTYWSAGGGHGKWLDLERVTLKLLCNVNDMRVILPSEIVYYDPNDVVDTRHSNDSMAPVYLRKNAVRSEPHVRQEIDRRLGEVDRDMAHLRRKREWLLGEVYKIDDGQLDAVYL